MNIRGENFFKSENLAARFIYKENKVTYAKVVYKNIGRLGVTIPEIDDLEPGMHVVTLELSFNG